MCSHLLNFDDNTTIKQLKNAAQRFDINNVANLDLMQLTMALKNELTKLAIEMKENDPNILILQDNLKDLRTYIDSHKLKISKQVGGKTGWNSKEDLRSAVINYIQEKSLKSNNTPHQTPSTPKSNINNEKKSINAGVGAYGIVSKVYRDPAFAGSFQGGHLAVKRPRNQQSKFRIQKEIDVFNIIMKNGGHPNIVHCFSTNKDTNEIYMEFLENNLLNAINDRRSEKKTDLNWHPLTVLLDIARGLEFLHFSANLIHTDLKDTNVMLDNYGRAKIIDFDTAQSPLTLDEIKNGVTLNCACSSAVDQKLRQRKGIFSYEVNIYNWGYIAKTLRNFIEKSTKLDDVITDLIERCMSFDHDQRPTSFEVAAKMNEIISDYRDETGEDIDSHLPEMELLYARAMVSNAPNHMDIDHNKLFAENENFALRLLSSKENVACSFRIGTFNVQNLGPKCIEKVDQLVDFIIGRGIDIIAIQEIRDNKKNKENNQTMKSILESKLRSKCPDDKWEIELSNSLREGKIERGIFAYKSKNIRCISPCSLTKGLSDCWTVKPFLGKFRIGSTKILICSVHLDPKDPHPQIKELGAFCNGLINEGAVSSGTQMIILGDFNLGANDPSFNELREAGWFHCLPSGIKTNKSEKDRKQFDNIFVDHKENAVISVNADNTGLNIGDHSLVVIDHAFILGNNESATVLLTDYK